MAALDASRPRILCLTRRVSSRAMFVGVLLILTSLFTIEAVAQNQVPTAPIGFDVIPGDKKIDLSWTAPSDPGSHTITDYKYAYTTSDPTNHPNQAWKAIGSTSTSHTLTGLTNGITYSISLRAVSGAGDGAVVGPLSAISTIPAPTNFTAAAGDGEVRLSWTPPTVVSGSPLTDYDFSKDDGANWETTGGDGTISTYIVTELTNENPYTFKIRAVRNAENGKASEAKSATPQAGVPTPPPPPPPQVQSLLGNTQSPVETEPATEQPPRSARLYMNARLAGREAVSLGKHQRHSSMNSRSKQTLQTESPFINSNQSQFTSIPVKTSKHLTDGH